MILPHSLDEALTLFSPLIAAILLLYGVLIAQKRQMKRRVIIYKSVLSLLYVCTAMWQPHPHTAFFYCILAALALDMAGDVLLALRQWRAFQIGLFLFLAGHLCCIAAFRSLTPLGGQLNLSMPFVLPFLAIVFWRLRPHLHSMGLPVLIYMMVIGAMMVGAFAVLDTPGIRPEGAWLITLGAGFVFVSDIFVARERFVKQSFYNRLIGLPLYYLGQFMLAYSVGLVQW